MRKYLCISNYCRIFASEKETNNKLNPKTRKGTNKMETRHNNNINYISNAIKMIREMYKDGSNGFGNGSNGYWWVTFKNGDEICIDDFHVEWEGLPKLRAREIKKIESWFDCYGEEYTEHDYLCYEKTDEYYKNMVAEA